MINIKNKNRKNMAINRTQLYDKEKNKLYPEMLLKTINGESLYSDSEEIENILISASSKTEYCYAAYSYGISDSNANDSAYVYVKEGKGVWKEYIYRIEETSEKNKYPYLWMRTQVSEDNYTYRYIGADDNLKIEIKKGNLSYIYVDAENKIIINENQETKIDIYFNVLLNEDEYSIFEDSITIDDNKIKNELFVEGESTFNEELFTYIKDDNNCVIGISLDISGDKKIKDANYNFNNNIEISIESKKAYLQPTIVSMKYNVIDPNAVTIDLSNDFDQIYCDGSVCKINQILNTKAYLYVGNEPKDIEKYEVVYDEKTFMVDASVINVDDVSVLDVSIIALAGTTIKNQKYDIEIKIDSGIDGYKKVKTFRVIRVNSNTDYDLVVTPTSIIIDKEGNYYNKEIVIGVRESSIGSVNNNISYKLPEDLSICCIKDGSIDNPIYFNNDLTISGNDMPLRSAEIYLYDKNNGNYKTNFFDYVNVDCLYDASAVIYYDLILPYTQIFMDDNGNLSDDKIELTINKSISNIITSYRNFDENELEGIKIKTHCLYEVSTENNTYRGNEKEFIFENNESLDISLSSIFEGVDKNILSGIELSLIINDFVTDIDSVKINKSIKNPIVVDFVPDVLYFRIDESLKTLEESKHTINLTLKRTDNKFENIKSIGLADGNALYDFVDASFNINQNEKGDNINTGTIELKIIRGKSIGTNEVKNIVFKITTNDNQEELKVFSLIPTTENCYYQLNVIPSYISLDNKGKLKENDASLNVNVFKYEGVSTTDITNDISKYDLKIYYYNGVNEKEYTLSNKPNISTLTRNSYVLLKKNDKEIYRQYIEVTKDGDTGADGSNGLDGSNGIAYYTKYAYATSSPEESAPPVPTSNDLTGTDYSFEFPITNEDVVWVIQSIWKKEGNNSEIQDTPWVGPTRFTGPKGPAGDPASATSKIPYPAGIWEAGTEYKQSDSTTPYVLHDSSYYILNVSCSKEDSFVEGQWIEMESFQSVYTDIALINNGTLGSAVFYKDFMYSKNKYDNNSIIIDKFSPYYSSGDKKSINTIITDSNRPSYLVDLATGEGYYAGGVIKFNKESAQLGEFIVDKNGFTYATQGSWGYEINNESGTVTVTSLRAYCPDASTINVKLKDKKSIVPYYLYPLEGRVNAQEGTKVVFDSDDKDIKTYYVDKDKVLTYLTEPYYNEEMEEKEYYVRIINNIKYVNKETNVTYKEYTINLKFLEADNNIIFNKLQKENNNEKGGIIKGMSVYYYGNNEKDLIYNYSYDEGIKYTINNNTAIITINELLAKTIGYFQIEFIPKKSADGEPQSLIKSSLEIFKYENGNNTTLEVYADSDDWS